MQTNLPSSMVFCPKPIIVSLRHVMLAFISATENTQNYEIRSLIFHLSVDMYVNETTSSFGSHGCPLNLVFMVHV